MNIVYKLIYVFSWHGFYTSLCANFAHTRFTLENCMHSNALVCDSSFYLLSSGLLPLISWMLTLYPETLLSSFISCCFVDLLLFYVCITMSLNRNSSASSILGNPFACVSFLSVADWGQESECTPLPYSDSGEHSTCTAVIMGIFQVSFSSRGRSLLLLVC